MLDEAGPGPERPINTGAVARTREFVSGAVDRFLGTEMDSPISGHTTRRDLWQGVVREPLRTAVAPVSCLAILDTGMRVFGVVDKNAPPPTKAYAEAAAIGLAYSVPVGALAAADIPITETVHLARRVKEMLPQASIKPPSTPPGKI